MRRNKHHLYVSDKRNIAAVQNDIIESLLEFIKQRFSMDEPLVSTLVPLVKLDKANTDLRAVHRLIGCDLDLAEMSLEFAELANPQKKLASLPSPQLVRYMSFTDCYPIMSTVMARILAAKPHSADVERCISANNLLKTTLRSSMTIATENTYLFIHHNLPPTANWDPKPAVLVWMSKSRRHRQAHNTKQQSYYRHVFTEAM